MRTWNIFLTRLDPLLSSLLDEFPDLKFCYASHAIVIVATTMDMNKIQASNEDEHAIVNSYLRVLDSRQFFEAWKVVRSAKVIFESSKEWKDKLVESAKALKAFVGIDYGVDFDLVISKQVKEIMRKLITDDMKEGAISIITKTTIFMLYGDLLLHCSKLGWYELAMRIVNASTQFVMNMNFICRVIASQGIIKIECPRVYYPIGKYTLVPVLFVISDLKEVLHNALRRFAFMWMGMSRHFQSAHGYTQSEDFLCAENQIQLVYDESMDFSTSVLGCLRDFGINSKWKFSRSELNMLVPANISDSRAFINIRTMREHGILVVH